MTRATDGKDPTELGVDPLPRRAYCPTCGASRHLIEHQEQILYEASIAHIKVAELHAQLALAAREPQAEAIKALTLRIAELELELELKRSTWAERKTIRQAQHINRIEQANAKLRALRSQP